MNGNNVRQPACQMSFRHAVLAFAIAVALGSGTASAGEKLDMSFIQGGAGINPEVWAALNGDYAPGRYLVDLSLNGKDIGKHILDVTPQDSEALCLSEAWLAKAGIYVSAEYFRKGYDATRQCWVLAKAPAVKVDFDVATQSLSLAIPQKGLVKMPENVEWDYGTEAFRMNYNANANSGRYNTSAFGSADLKANIGRWVVSSSATASTGDGGSNEATINMFTATRAIRSLSADLAVGKTSTGDSLLGSTGTYGVSLSRNNSMKPGNLGYTPVSRNMNGENTWSASASVSVPFTLFERKYSSSTTVSTGKDGGTGVSTGLSGALNDRFSYGLGGGRDSDGGVSSYLNAAYSGDRANLNGTVNHSSGSGTSGSVSASGSVLAVPAARDIMFSRTTGDTVAVVSVKDTPGVKVMSGNETSDSDGNLVVPLNSYDWNTVTIDAGTLPLDTELSTTSRKVVPTDRAVVWMPFDALKVHRYLLQVRMPDGAFVPGGTWARDSNNTPLGFVANNGVLMINAVDRPGDITLGQCRIPAAKLQETAKLQEITCE
ncbi:fimbria/pilus outer membrane usher protein [Salmonella enterica]|nr:fimbria/pilus outer membrane usher protein [Salmonella enterica]